MTDNVSVIILSGACDFGRDTIASRMPAGLWQVVDRPALERLIRNLLGQGIKNITICSNGDSTLLERTIDIKNQPDLELRFLNEELPVGTAGSIRDAAKKQEHNQFLILPAAMIHHPEIGSLIDAHQKQGADLTVVFNPGMGLNERGAAANIYVCNSSVLKCIPEEGYYDIKEGLIPEMIRLGRPVRCVTLPHRVGNFHNRERYIDAISDYLENSTDIADIDLKRTEQNGNHIIWKGNGVIIEPGARFFGRVVLGDGVHIGTNAVIFGPTILGRNVKIGTKSIVINSVLWDNSQVGDNCEIQRSIIDYDVAITSNSTVTEQSVAFAPKGIIGSILGRLSTLTQDRINKLESSVTVRWLASAVVLIAFLWSYWPGIMDMWNIWQRSDEYSAGLLVPFLAVYILWSRRQRLARVEIRPSLWGIPAFIGAQAVRFFGLFFMFGSAERLSVVLSIASLVLLLFGWELFRKVSTIMLFLILMLPWPNRVQAAIALPLQNWSTSSAVFCLETLGYEVVREGNVIHIGQASVAVAEACNGLRMITAFFVISGLVVLLVNRSWWEKLIVFVSSLPIALFCNTLRLTITAIAFTVLKGEYWEKIFHDFGGYAMMPLALAIVVGEFWFLTKLTTAPKEEKVVLIKGRQISD
jgi:exosortase